MKITSIRVRKLITGPNYSHHAIEAESKVEDYEAPETVRGELSQWVDEQLGRQQEVDDLTARAHALRRSIYDLENDEGRKRAQIREIRTLLSGVEKLAEVAKASGNEALLKFLQDKEDEEIPF